MICFRPLDGESISKLDLELEDMTPQCAECFRPLDGESISKLL